MEYEDELIDELKIQHLFKRISQDTIMKLYGTDKILLGGMHRLNDKQISLSQALSMKDTILC